MMKLERIAQAEKRLKIPRRIVKRFPHSLSESFTYHQGWKDGFKACKEIYRKAFEDARK